MKKALFVLIVSERYNPPTDEPSMFNAIFSYVMRGIGKTHAPGDDSKPADSGDYSVEEIKIKALDSGFVLVVLDGEEGPIGPKCSAAIRTAQVADVPYLVFVPYGYMMRRLVEAAPDSPPEKTLTERDAFIVLRTDSGAPLIIGNRLTCSFDTVIGEIMTLSAKLAEEIAAMDAAAEKAAADKTESEL